MLVNINDLRAFSSPLAKELLTKPLELIPAFEKALEEIVLTIGGKNAVAIDDLVRNPMHIGLEGSSFGDLQCSPRTISCSLLGCIVALEGIVTSCSLVRPRLARSVHFSQAKSIFYAQEYRDSAWTSGQAPTSNAYPTQDPDGNALSSEFGFSIYRDHQVVTVQEMPERAPPGQLPRGVEVLFADDLVDAVKPGDRIQVIGAYRALAALSGAGQVPGTFRTVLLANGVRKLHREQSDANRSVSEGDLAAIRELGRRKDVFEILARSIAPSIHGHLFIKKAILLMLLGGVEKNLENGTHIRGDVNLLLIGDPSTAKSQLLRFVMALAPLAISTTGRGASGVGLTAAVTHDRDTGDRRLEAGAMVLADRGVVCVDEFDKMSEEDRVAIHEVMEQQTVTISKAGIHATLNARCSTIAAANPVFGQYRESVSPQDNIRLPDSLLSRFDLTFVVLDRIESANDRKISQHVLRMHRWMPPGLDPGTPMGEETIAILLKDPADQQYLEKGEALLDHPMLVDYAPATVDEDELVEDLSEEEELQNTEDHQILPLALLKSYITIAKATFKPILTKQACDFVAETYAALRQAAPRHAPGSEDAGRSSRALKTFPVTARSLETLIRLATAHAKARLSNRVDKRDAIVAKQLLEFCLYKETKSKPRRKQRKAQHDQLEEENDIAAEVPDGQNAVVAESNTFDTPSGDSQLIAASSSGTTWPKLETPALVTSSERTIVRRALNLYRDQNSVADMIEFDKLLCLLDPGKISRDQVIQILREMEDANQIMFRDEFIIFI